MSTTPGNSGWCSTFSSGSRRPPSQPARDEARRKAQATVLARLRAGADFGALALTESQDLGSARDSGYLPPSPRGKFVTAFDSAAWALPPGGLSGIVETPFGYHIIRRPGPEAVRDGCSS